LILINEGHNANREIVDTRKLKNKSFMDYANNKILLDEISTQMKTIEDWKHENDKHDEFIIHHKKRLKAKDKEVGSIKILLC